MSDGEESEGMNRSSSASQPSAERGSNASTGQSRWGTTAPSPASVQSDGNVFMLGGGGGSPLTADPSTFDAESVRSLLAAIDQEIVPALENTIPPKERVAVDLADKDADTLLKLLLKQDFAATIDFLETLRQRPVPLMVLFTDLMGPVARRLGDMWANDECSFVEVTVGVSHLQRLVRDFSPLYQSDIRESPVAGSVLLASVSDEQHTFGLSLLGEVFRRAGWTVTEAPRHTRKELKTLLRAQNYDLYGFSLSCIELLDSLKADIELVRETGSSGERRVIVGGPAFTDNPDIVETMLVDGYAHDAGGALALAQALIGDMKGVNP